MVSTVFIRSFVKEFRTDLALMAGISAFSAFGSFLEGGYESGLFLLLLTFLLVLRSVRLFKQPIKREDDFDDSGEEAVALSNALFKKIRIETGAFALFIAYIGIDLMIEHIFSLGSICILISLLGAMHLRSAFKSSIPEEIEEFSIVLMQEMIWEFFLVALFFLIFSIEILKQRDIISGLISLSLSFILFFRLFTLRTERGHPQVGLPFSAKSLLQALVKYFRWELILVMILFFYLGAGSAIALSFRHTMIFILIAGAIVRRLFFMPPVEAESSCDMAPTYIRQHRA